MIKEFIVGKKYTYEGSIVSDDFENYSGKVFKCIVAYRFGLPSTAIAKFENEEKVLFFPIEELNNFTQISEGFQEEFET